MQVAINRLICHSATTESVSTHSTHLLFWEIVVIIDLLNKDQFLSVHRFAKLEFSKNID